MATNSPDINDDNSDRQPDLERLAKADAIVSRYTKYALASGLIPVPLLDLALISGLQLNMLRKLSNLYETRFSEQRGKAALAALVSGGGAVSVASMARVLPGIGHIAGAFTVTATAAASTYAVGKVFIQHFEAGGTILTFEPQKVRAYYNEQLKSGQQTVRETHVNAGRKP